MSCPAASTVYGRCILKSGHTGRHFGLGRPGRAASMFGDLCGERHPDGGECVRPAGHDGAHRGRVWADWSDEGRLF